MKKILLDGRLISDKPTGISRYSKELVKIYQDIFGYENVLVIVTKELKNKKFRYIETNFKPFNLIHFFLLKRMLLDKLDFDIYHSFFYVNSFFKIPEKIYILTVHDLMYKLLPSFFSSNRFIEYFGKKYYDILVKKSLNNSDYIISVSKTTKSDLKKYFNKKSIFVPEGVNIIAEEAEKISELEGKEYLLYVGNSRRHKNLEFLCSSFEEIKTNRKLVLVGTGDEFKYKSKKIILLGKVSDKKLKWLYKNSLAFIFPSLYEGFGLPILEALYNDCLVISSTGGALKDFKINSIKYFDPKDKESLIKHFEKLDQYNNDKIEVEKLLNRYTWKKTEKYMRRIIEIIRS